MAFYIEGQHPELSKIILNTNDVTQLIKSGIMPEWSLAQVQGSNGLLVVSASKYPVEEIRAANIVVSQFGKN